MFKFWQIDLSNEEGIEVKTIIDGKQVKSIPSSRKSTRGATARGNGKSTFVDIFDNREDLEYVAEEIFARRHASRHTKIEKKMKHMRHMLKQLTK